VRFSEKIMRHIKTFRMIPESLDGNGEKEVKPPLGSRDGQIGAVGALLNFAPFITGRMAIHQRW
jgi:hypothetical protein